MAKDGGKGIDAVSMSVFNDLSCRRCLFKACFHAFWCLHLGASHDFRL